MAIARVCSCPWQSWQGSADRLDSSDECFVFQNFLTVLFMIRIAELINRSPWLCQIHEFCASENFSPQYESAFYNAFPFRGFSMIVHVSSHRTGFLRNAWISDSDFRAFVFRAFVDRRIGAFQVEEDLKRFIHQVSNVNTHNDGRTVKLGSRAGSSCSI